jgi:outer membrane protein OmpA-like peptidoglycan-associated protein
MIVRTRATLYLVSSLISLALPGCAGMDKGGAAPAVSAATAPGAKVYTWSPSMERKRLALEKATSDSGIAVLRTKDNQLQVNVPSDFSFDTDSAAIKPGMRPVLDQFAEDLEIPAMSRMRVLVVGHTDSRGADAVNDALSLARAMAVRKYLESKGIGSNRIAVEGRGEREPMAAGDMGYARALNRRVEMFLHEPTD